MKNRFPTLFASLVIGGSLLLISTGVVAAVTTPGGPSGKGVCATQAAAVKAGASVDTLRAMGDCEINRRFTTLSQLGSRVSGSKVLTSSDAAALTAEIGSTTSGLTSLKATIDAETSISALQTEIKRIATDYRVYLLVGPQVNLVSAADGVTASQTRFSKVNTNLTSRIAAAKAAGKDVTAAQAALDKMNAAVTAAVGLARTAARCLAAPHAGSVQQRNRRAHPGQRTEGSRPGTLPAQGRRRRRKGLPRRPQVEPALPHGKRLRLQGGAAFRRLGRPLPG